MSTPFTGRWSHATPMGIGVILTSGTDAWALRSTADGGQADVAQFNYGGPQTWYHVIGDWAGDGIDGFGAFDPDTATWVLRNTLSGGNAEIAPFQYGTAWSVPVVGRWKSGAKADGIGVIDTGPDMRLGAPPFVEGGAGYWHLRNDA